MNVKMLIHFFIQDKWNFIIRILQPKKLFRLKSQLSAKTVNILFIRNIFALFKKKVDEDS